MAERVVLHIGLPKCATTYLQSVLWAAADRLRAGGVLLPGERRDHLWASRVVREDPDLALPARRAEDKRSSWDRLRAEIEAWPGTALISHEFFAAAGAGQAVRMVEQLAPAPVEIVVVAREPLGLFASSWQESLKNRATTPIDAYARTVSEDPGDVWNWRALDLRLVLERWSRAVPAERIHVLPLDTAGPREEIWERFAGLLGLAAAGYDLTGAETNPSLGVVEAETLRRVNAHLGSFRQAFDRGVWIRTFLADQRLAPRSGERFWPPADRVEECRRRGEEALAHLAAHPYDVCGDAGLLRVPDVLPERRTPADVTDAEVAALATELVGVLLGDVRDLSEGRG